jgi:pSer/pThr/pTyr-binding forkhead associated (FHA) protein
VTTDCLWLVVRADDGRRLVAVTGDRLTIGRDLRAGVVLDDVKVSRLHAEITRDADGGFHLTDLSSRNGTLVDGRQLVGAFRLQGGEVLRIGRTTVEVHLEEPGVA